MGYIRHHAIIVTSFDEGLIQKAYMMALEIFDPQHVSPVIGPVTNAFYTFFVGPDGSKEGWKTSDDGDERRDRFIVWLDMQRHEDGSTSLDWVEVQYGDDNHETCIVRDSDQWQREAQQ